MQDVDLSKDKAPSPVFPNATPESKLERKVRLSGYFTIVASGFALISDGLQNNILTLTNVVNTPVKFATVYSGDHRVSNSLLVGAIIGRMLFYYSLTQGDSSELAVGFICDRFGRKTGIVLTTAFICVGIILVTAAHGANGSVYGFFWFLIIARGITGIGVGGEYPASSTSAAEAANEKALSQRGPIFIMVTNFVLSFGTPLACIIYLIVFEAAGGVESANYSTVWRTVFGISCIFPVTVFYFRIRMLNSVLYQKSAIKHDVPYKLTVRYYWRSIIGTAFSWFLYGEGIFSGIILSNVIHEEGRALFKKTAEWNLLLGTIALPGVILGALLVNRLGRRNLMICGFGGYLVIGLIVGIAYDKVTQHTGAFVVLYGLMQSSGNFGPGNVLGLASSESYATPVRGTLYGFSAAVGKAGAAVGVQCFQPIRDNLGKRWTFIVAAIIGVFGMLNTFLFLRNDLGGDLAIEDAKFEAYLRNNGWKGHFGSLDAEIVDTKLAEPLSEKNGQLL